MPDFDTVVYNSLKRHNTNNLSYSMYKIDEKICILCSFVDMYPLVCGAGVKIHSFEINSHDMILNIKLTGCPMFLTFASLM